MVVTSINFSSSPATTAVMMTASGARYETAWWRHQMETFSALLAICAGNSSVPGEFPAQRPVTRNFDVFFDLRLNKRLSKQPRGWWFETPSWSLWRQCNGSAWWFFVSVEMKNLHWKMFVHSILSQHCFRQWPGAEHATSNYLDKCWLSIWPSGTKFSESFNQNINLQIQEIAFENVAQIRIKPAPDLT